MKLLLNVQCILTLLFSITILFGIESCKKDVPNYTLIVDILPAGSGSVTLSPGGGTYREGTEVTLTPLAGSSDKFVKWAGADEALITGNKIVMSKNMRVSADFIAQYSLTVHINPAGSGTVAFSPDDGTYDDGTLVTLNPNGIGSYFFSGWGGIDGSYVLKNKVIMSKNIEVTANFDTVFTGRVSNGIWYGDYPDLGYADQIAFNIYNNALTTTNSSLHEKSTGDALSMVFIVYAVGYHRTLFHYDDIPIVNNKFSCFTSYSDFTTTVSGTFTSSTSCNGKVTMTEGSDIYTHNFVASFQHSKKSIFSIPVPYSKSDQF